MDNRKKHMPFHKYTPYGKKHLKELVPKDGLQYFKVQGRGDTEHAAAIETTVHDHNVTMRIISDEVDKRQDGDHGSKHRIGGVKMSPSCQHLERCARFLTPPVSVREG